MGACLSLTVGRAGERQPRQAQVEVRWGRVRLQPPRHHRRRRELPEVEASVILVEERQVPAGESPMRWLLLTTLQVNSFQTAQQYVRWYSYRWLIERYHFVLKSGC